MQYLFGKGLGKDPSMTYHLWQFDSIKELADTAIATDRSLRFSSEREGDERFNVTKSVDEAYTLAVDGWHGIRESVDAHLMPLRERLGEVLSVIRDRMYDVIGSDIDIDRYLDGEVECMIDDIYQEQPHNGKVFTMIIDGSLTYDNDAQDVLKRGAVLCALVEAFDMLGYQLELWGEWTFKGDKPGFGSVLTRFNNAGEPLDIDSVMFALGSPDWFRRIGFAFGEGRPELASFGFDGRYYGMHRNGSHMYDRIGASAIVSIDGNREMTRDPIAWILGQLEEQGVIDNG